MEQLRAGKGGGVETGVKGLKEKGPKEPVRRGEKLVTEWEDEAREGCWESGWLAR